MKLWILNQKIVDLALLQVLTDLFFSSFNYSGILGHVYWYKQSQISGTVLPWRWLFYNLSKRHYKLATRNVSPIDSKEHARRSNTWIFDVQLPPRIVISTDSSIFSNKSLAFSRHLWSHAPPPHLQGALIEFRTQSALRHFALLHFSHCEEPLFHFLNTTQHDKYRLQSKSYM